jgi:hypothetical protein
MELSIRELNELIYCIGIARMHGQLLGTTVADTLDDKLRAELDKRLQIDLTPNSHYVSNEEADEDALHMLTSFPINQPFTSEYKAVKERGWITQSILDYVENTGPSTYKELNEFYRFITGGSNSFSHHLYNLITPYKNRKTQRYLAKNANGKYVVRIASIHNWVVVND